ncbi:hypothetical protein GCM10018962_07620 [Dactylosporangium matsuzakiense]|uniref:RNA polymerase sigma-70 factor (ECF subfamily) n=2 Tax=Dactylosporangium matsuzakiense TaxID=53360 RepID=A0A9W6KEV9_9ACTN|nr:RNA polymerase sigma factor [Dactylosporangium matsuzakiense]GLK98774.1 hypothetical protein GCM10017581_005150 [Dactylosporangium matsuzakiense]
MQRVRDEDLASALAAAIDGDAAGFAVLWRTLHPPLLRYLRVVCGDASEDVASETWLQASRDLSGFDGTTAAFRVWLFRIARHRGIDENRRAWRRHEEPHEAVDQLRSAAAAPDVATEVVELDDTDRALRLIAGLPRDQAEAVMLRVVAGLDVAGTARVLGKRSGAVRIATMRGLRKLAEHPEVQAQHDGVRAEHSEAQAQPQPQPDGLDARHDGVPAQHHGVPLQPDGVPARQDGVPTQHDGVRVRHDGIQAQHDGVGAGHDGMQAQQDGMQARHDSMRAQQNGMQARHDSVRAQQDGMQARHDGFRARHGEEGGRDEA